MNNFSSIVSSGGSSQITVNGLSIKVQHGQVYVNGQLYGPVNNSGEPVKLPEPQRVEMDKDGVINGDVHGDLYIVGTVPVNLVVKGNVDGSVKSESGNVTCSNVGGSLKATGNV